MTPMLPDLRFRQVHPEVLDQLPADHPTARQIHRDIDRYNRILGNYPWIQQVLASDLQPGDRVLEIAAGQGKLLHHLRQRGTLTPASRIAAFDAICPRPPYLPASVEWTTTDAESFPDYAAFNVILVNHFWHQLSDEALAVMGQHLQSARVILANETLRRPQAHLLCRLSRLIGFSKAGIHDGLRSVEAGFRGDELPTLLGINVPAWRCQILEHPLGAYRLRAIRS